MAAESNTVYNENEHLQELVSNHRQQRERAWRQLCKEFFPMVQQYVEANKGTRDDSFDVFQQTVEILYQNLTNGVFKGRSSLKTYFSGIARNVWIDQLRKQKKQDKTIEEALIERSLGDDDNADQARINTEIVGILLQKLDEECRQYLQEYYFHGRRMKELMANSTVNSIQAAKNKKYRCMNRLRELYKEGTR
jgi:RNA polymerase sigma factor (sigma-70 family)